jgi:hypothetical protein
MSKEATIAVVRAKFEMPKVVRDFIRGLVCILLQVHLPRGLQTLPSWLLGTLGEAGWV